ncbi:oligodendrocyte-myelin glycoprotein-like [Oncorhynchus masou masou]|uniref:oligodendrocyte-myelin glycoprotein-like n=1 Tax=Oncorhynchus masou masou TaxID=90313 RepID=UPI00318393EE
MSDNRSNPGKSLISIAAATPVFQETKAGAQPGLRTTEERRDWNAKMRKRRVLLMPHSGPPHCVATLWLLMLLCLQALAVCPPMCTCNRSHREVDCSWRGLRTLPLGLQHNLHSLNLSHNRIHDLDGQLSNFAHLRTLDLSHNRLVRLPTALPKALWELHAAANHIHLLDKNDTAYQWNLRVLDLSNNKLERAVFINNTLSSLRLLNFSNNHFWTVPTNMPASLETVDLSHNSLVQILPGTLNRMSRLTTFYLHSNRFSSVGPEAFSQLGSLSLLSLGDNPWACEHQTNITHLLAWLQHTSTRVLGCPCHTHPVCGEPHPARTGGWHFASYTQPPLAAGTQEERSHPPPPEALTRWPWYLSESALLNTQLHTRRAPGRPSGPENNNLFTDHYPFTSTPLAISTLSTDRSHTKSSTSTTDDTFITDTTFTTDSIYTTDTAFTTNNPSTIPRRTATLRTRSVKRANKGGSPDHNTSPAPSARSKLPLVLNLWLLLTLTLYVL